MNESIARKFEQDVLGLSKTPFGFSHLDTKRKLSIKTKNYEQKDIPDFMPTPVVETSGNELYDSQLHDDLNADEGNLEDELKEEGLGES